MAEETPYVRRRRRGDAHASGPSGRSQSKAARRAAGLVRVEVWLSAEAARELDARADGSSKRAVIEALLSERAG